MLSKKIFLIILPFIILFLCLLGYFSFRIFRTKTVFADGIIKEHGKYSNTYLSDWSNLPTGKEIIQENLQGNIKTALGLGDSDAFNLKTGEGFKSVEAENITTSRTWTSGENTEIHLNNFAYKVKWNTIPYHGVLFYYRGYKKVVIENLAIIEDNNDYRTYNAIIVKDCDEVIVRNVYFSGTAGHAHLRIEGCKNITIENIEAAGIDYAGNGKYRAGAGINILNGEPGYPLTPVLEWLTIQNCYFHDLNENDGTWRNQDAILLESPANGILFNCYFENWDKNYGDAAIDAGHRNMDAGYAANHLFRIERNIINNSYTKNPGGALNNILLWTNNLYLNAMHDDYHSNYDVYHINNTYIYNSVSPKWFYELDDFQGPSYSYNNLIYNQSLQGQFNYFIDQNLSGSPDKWKGYHSDYNALIMGFYPHDKWVAGDSCLYTLDGWKDAGNEIHSIIDIKEEEGSNILVNASNGNSGEFINWTGNNPDGWQAFGVNAANYIRQESGKCRIVNTDSAIGIYQSNVLTTGKLYKYGINIINVNSGGIRLGNGATLAYFNKPGQRVGYFTAYENNFVIKRDSNPTDVTFDDVWVKEVSAGEIDHNQYFKDFAGGNYRLPAVSNASDAGSNGYIHPTDLRMTISQDFYGVSRGENPSIGAFENEIINQAPSVKAGADQIITFPSEASLSGAASDDGFPNPPGIFTTIWSKVSGIGDVIFSNPSNINTKASFSSIGSYILRLTANDGAVTNSDDINIAVNGASSEGEAGGHSNGGGSGGSLGNSIGGSSGGGSGSSSMRDSEGSPMPLGEADNNMAETQESRQEMQESVADANSENNNDKLMEEVKGAVNLYGLSREAVEYISQKEAKIIGEQDKSVNLDAKEINLYEKIIKQSKASLQNKEKYSIAMFIKEGTSTTKILGTGERAGVINSYIAAFEKIPTIESDWQDVIKIANGRWPSETRLVKEIKAKEEIFKKIYKREADMNYSNDNAAVVIIAYGLRPAHRNLLSEKSAINIFKGIYGHNPVRADEWDIARAIAYSGAKR
ncbi:MAG: hypothetical protein V1860_02205 [bacterium]